MKKLLFAKKFPGFTIVEVTIVLAVAALIMALVFIGLQFLQRSQRTHATEEAASRVIAAIQNYSQDNGGVAAGTDLTAPPAGLPDGKQYLLSANVPSYDLSTGQTVPQAGNIGDQADNNNRIIYRIGAICGSGGALADGAAAQFAVSYWSETAGGPVCKQSG